MWIVLAALIAAIPASIAAVASLRGNKQLKANGGSTVRDAVDRIESSLKLQNVVLTQHDNRLERIETIVIQTAKDNPAS
jgi:archaellin